MSDEEPYRPYRKGERFDWRDPQMRCIRAVEARDLSTGKTWIETHSFSSDYNQQVSQQNMLQPALPHWSDDPSYNWNKRRRRLRR